MSRPSRLARQIDDVVILTTSATTTGDSFWCFASAAGVLDADSQDQPVTTKLRKSGRLARILVVPGRLVAGKTKNA
jgi:hypothetical protein